MSYFDKIKEEEEKIKEDKDKPSVIYVKSEQINTRIID